MLGFYALGEQALGGVSTFELNDYSITAEAASFTLTGIDANTISARSLSAAAGTYTLTGNSATLAITLNAAAGSFALTVQSSPLLAARSIAADAGSFALSGQSSRVLRAGIIPAAAGTFSLSLLDAELFGGARLDVDTAGEFVLSGFDAAKVHEYVLRASATPTSFGGSEHFLFSPLGAVSFGGSNDREQLLAETTFELTGQSAFVSHVKTISAGFGEYVLTGNSAGVFFDQALVALPGVFVLTGQDGGLLHAMSFDAETGVFVLSGLGSTTFLNRRLMGAKLGGGTTWRTAC